MDICGYKNKMKDFRKDLETIENKIRNKEHFSFARYGDGEMAIIDNRSIDILNKENGEFNFKSSSDEDQRYRTMLVDAFTNSSENYFIGIGCPCCIGQAGFERMKHASKQQDQRLTWANLFVNSNYSYFMSNIVPLFSMYDVYIVCNEKATLDNLPFKDNIKKDWRVGSNAWKNNHEVEEQIKKTNPNNSLFVIAAGPYSKILCNNLWNFNKNNTYLDIGSTLDPFLFGSRGYTRGYLRGASTLRKKCIWGGNPQRTLF